MSILDAIGPTSRPIGDSYEITRKPRSVDRYANATVSFAPMEGIPSGGAFAPAYVMKQSHAVASGTYFESGDILVAKITPSFENGKQALTRDLGDAFGYATTEVIPIRPKAAGHDPRVLFYYLLHPDIRAFVAERMEGSTGRQRVPEGVLLELPLPCFTGSEQTAIGDALDHVQRALQLEDALAKESLILKRATMRQLFTRGLHGKAQKETEIGLVPEHWNIHTLVRVATIERGRFLHRPRNEPRFYGGKTPFVQTGDVVRSAGRIRTFSQSLNAEGVAISRVFPIGTILITIAANIGYTCVLEIESACPDSLVGISAREGVDKYFLEYFLQTQQPSMDRNAPKGTQKNINIQFLNPWPVPVPPMDEQREIATILDTIDRKIDLHKRKRAVLESLFKSLLHKLMTGEIRVADLNLSALESTVTAGASA